MFDEVITVSIFLAQKITTKYTLTCFAKPTPGSYKTKRVSKQVKQENG